MELSPSTGSLDGQASTWAAIEAPDGTPLTYSEAREWQIALRVAKLQVAAPPRRSVIHLADLFQDILHRITAGPTLAYAILILALILAPKIAETLRLPAMVGLVLAGMALGPHGTGALASKEIALSALGEFGLLYLMFSAGLELDLKLFMKMKKAAITFALLSFAIPFTLGIVSARFLDYKWAAAVLMGSNWGSHTLVTYPLLRQMGLARNRAVATVVGATAVTDTSALLVLSVISGTVKPGGALGLQLLGIAIGLVVLGVWSLLALPRVARWFFAHVGTDRAYRFIFGIAAFLVGAVMAEAAGIDGIVGAFFAGLGLNRAVPEESPLMDRLQFMGSTLFIPIFLVSVGILLEPKVMVDPKTLEIALIFTVAVLGGKALAAVIAGRTFRFTWPEVGVMSGLSGSQAAATLATTLVGAKLGLFDKQTINAVLVVILASLVVTPALVSLFGKRVTAVTEEAAALGKTVLVPVWGDSTRPVLALAGELATSDGGIVLAASFARTESSPAEQAAQRGLTTEAEGWLAKEGLESRTLFRIAETVPEGLLETILGEKATLLINEWHARDRIQPDSEQSEALARSPVPTLIAHGDVAHFERVLIVTHPDNLVRPGRQSLELAAALAPRFAHGRPIRTVSATSDPVRALFADTKEMDWIEARDPVDWIKRNLQKTDLPFFAGLVSLGEALQRVPALLDGRFLVALAAHEETTFHKREERVAGPVVAGRSLKPHLA
jgi:Kef-type K+ transport system membrane component KefB